MSTKRDRFNTPCVMLGLAVVALSACNDDAPAEACTVVQTEQGVIIDCPDQDPIELPDCAAGLPDLDGDGAMTARDCALAGVGETTRQICSAEDGYRVPLAWFASPACRGLNAEILATSAADTWPVGVEALADLTEERAGLGVAYVLAHSGEQEIVFQVDRNSDGLIADDETHTIWTGPNLSIAGGAMRGAAGEAAEVQLVFREVNSEGTTLILRVWTDRNRDGSLSNDEVSTIASSQAALAEAARYLGQTLLVSYVENGAARIWWDTDQDGAIDGAEVETYSALSSGLVIVADELWIDRGATIGIVSGRDRNEDGQVSESELFSLNRSCPTGSLRAVIGPYLLCQGGATSLGDDLLGHSYLGHGRDGVAFRGAFWLDVNRNNRAEDTEFAPIDASEHAVVLPTSPFWLISIAYDNLNEATIEHRRYARPERTRYLGELCDDEAWLACTTGLECRVSGNAAEPHCVPRQMSADQ